MAVENVPEHINFMARYATEIIAGFVAVLLAAMKLLGSRQIVAAPTAAQPATKVELLEVQLEINKSLCVEFDKLRTEMRTEIGTLHKRLDDVIKSDS